MRKITILIIALMVVSVGFLSGCNEQKTSESQSSNTNTNNNLPTENQKPTASCSANRTNGIVPLSVSFISSGTDSDGYIAYYSWDFGDGSISTQQNLSHTFTNGGTYNVMFTVTDNKDATDSDTVSITVKVPEPEILEDVSYSYSDTWVSIDGIIKNVANVPINNVDIKATLYDKSGNIIKTNKEWSDITESYRYDSPHPGYIKPGETSYFSITFQDVQYYDHYAFEIISFKSGISEGCREGLVISNIKNNIGSLGYEVAGKIKNEGSNKQILVSVWGAFYSSDGSLVCVDRAYLPVDMYSGQEEEFRFTVYDWHIDPNRISNYDLKIDAFCYS